MVMNGALSRAAYCDRAIDGALSFSGTVQRFRYWITGTLTWKAVRQVASTLSFAAAVARFTHYRRQVISKALLLQAGGWLELQSGGPLLLAQAKILTFSSSLTRRIITIAQVSVVGVLTQTAALSRSLFQYRSAAGVLSFSATITRIRSAIHRGLASVVSFGSTIAPRYIAHRSLAAFITCVGVISRANATFFRSIAGVLSFVGIVRKKMLVAIVAVLSFAGAIVALGGTIFSRIISGVLSIAGTIAFGKVHFKRILVGILSSVGTASSAIGQYISGVLAFAGAAVRVARYNRPVDSTLSFTVTVLDSFHRYVKSISSVLTFRGISRRFAAYVKKGLSKLGFNLKVE